VTELLYFIGVSTGGSSIMHLFPVWAGILGLDARIRGRDLPLRADRTDYRAVVDEVRRSPEVRGALVTTHKVGVYHHAHDLFDELDRYARICREVSCLSKRAGSLVGHAKDPISAGLALEHILGRDYWSRRGGHLLCLGAGGAGTAITVHVLTNPAPPLRMVVTDTDPDRMAMLKTIHGELGAGTEIEYRTVTGADESDRLLLELPPCSVVVNATGMGKDVPGSPVMGRTPFPEEGVVWDLNYRGTLEFLHQARAQAATRRLLVHDGWGYFLHGWTQVIAEVFDLDLDPELFGRLADAAKPLRP
jgi:shikimate 5-dehydrogenase